MEKINLEVQIRNEMGTKKVRKVRREDFIPGIVYGEEKKPTSVKVDRRIFERLERQHRGESVVLHLDVLEGEKRLRGYSTLIKEIQHDPVSDKILHIDFQRISLTEELEVKVSIVAKGEPIGVKKDGGALDHLLWELDVVCLPTNIPQHIDVDVSVLNIHDVIYVKDLVLPEGVRTKHDPEAIVFTVVPPAKEEEEAVLAEEETAEPEVTKEKKEKESEATEEEKSAKE